MIPSASEWVLGLAHIHRRQQNLRRPAEQNPAARSTHPRAQKASKTPLLLLILEIRGLVRPKVVSLRVSKPRGVTKRCVEPQLLGTGFCCSCQGFALLICQVVQEG